MAGVVEEITIKKEIEDSSDIPDQGETPDSSNTQIDSSGNQKHTKVWGEDETRSLIDLHKTYLKNAKENNYPKRKLLEEVSRDMNMIGYNTTPENVRNKMKYLRTKYKKNLLYNAKHVQKRIMPFQDELEELYSMDGFDDDLGTTKQLNGSVSSSTYSPGSQRPVKKAKTIPASHVDLRTVVTSKKKSVSQLKSSKAPYKKKINGKRSAQPLFQCGLCMMKFRTSFDMHGHPCKAVGKTLNHSSPKKKETSPNVLTIWLKPTGNAPIIKIKKWTVDKDTPLANIMGFLKQYMKLESTASVFLYVNQAFAPSPDHEVGNVYDVSKGAATNWTEEIFGITLKKQ